MAIGDGVIVGIVVIVAMNMACNSLWSFVEVLMLKRHPHNAAHVVYCQSAGIILTRRVAHIMS